MANHFSALKRARQTEKRTARNRANTSRLRSALRDATNAFLATLDRYTLEDLTRPRRALARLLGIEAQPAALSR